MDDLLNDIEVPSLEAPDLDASFCSPAPAGKATCDCPPAASVIDP